MTDLKRSIWGFEIDIWRGCFYFLIAVYGLTILLTFQDYGITTDENSHIQYGARVVSWYTSFFQDRSIFNRANVWLYGGIYDAIEFVLTRISPLNPYDTRHS